MGTGTPLCRLRILHSLSQKESIIFLELQEENSANCIYTAWPPSCCRQTLLRLTRLSRLFRLFRTLFNETDRLITLIALLAHFPQKSTLGARLSEVSLGQSSINRNQVARRTPRLWAGQEKDGSGTIFRINRLMRQCSLSVELRQQIPQLLIGGRFFEGYAIFCQPRGR